MAQEKYIIGRKLNILDLASQLGNISDACRKLGVSRQHYYDIKSALEEEGVEGLLEKARNKPRIGNRVAPRIEERVLAYSLEFPTHGQIRVANELKQEGVMLSPGGVRGIWLRNSLERKSLRLKRLEKWSAEQGNILTESQVQALETAKEEKEAHGEIETFHSGFLLGQDTVYVGWIKGIGKIYQQTGIDTFSNVAFAKVYLEKTALTAADLLNDKVLPFFDEQETPLMRTLTDRGTEYCGVLEKTIPTSFSFTSMILSTAGQKQVPQTNGCTERLNQIILEEFYQVAFRKKRYTTLDEIQADLDEYINQYNTKRTNQGKHCSKRL
ncbi:MAG: DDE-type integrase/transposase/recombinase [Nitrospinae bacterium]|nr:DDE-type integrase/transposase/recombinase [Nitrospinota bacterium]